MDDLGAEPHFSLQKESVLVLWNLLLFVSFFLEGLLGLGAEGL